MDFVTAQSIPMHFVSDFKSSFIRSVSTAKLLGDEQLCVRNLATSVGSHRHNKLRECGRARSLDGGYRDFVVWLGDDFSEHPGTLIFELKTARHIYLVS